MSWIIRNYVKAGSPLARREVDGVIFDVDVGHLPSAKDADVNNDLVADAGLIAGRNDFGEGRVAFYQAIRAKLPGKMVVGGSDRATLNRALNGTQMESALEPRYRAEYDGFLARYRYRMRQRKPAYSDLLTRTPNVIYDRYGEKGSARPLSEFRFQFGSMLHVTR